MKTSIIGFPRIGENRELKFALEKYFKKEIKEEELEKVTGELRKKHWFLQKEAGIGFISSNDFSYYDTILDTSLLFNIIPKRFKELGLSSLDTYFAMARGYQGEAGDVKALSMRKWFNTNYHYIVPEIEKDTEIKLTGEKIFEEYLEAKNLGIETKAVLTGPFTLFKLSKIEEESDSDKIISDFIKAYIDLLKRSEKIGIQWLQLEEPSLVLDLSQEDKDLFKRIYELLLAEKGRLKILLQTYFGDIRDCYKEVIELPFDGAGLDFTEGIKNLELLKDYGFPKEKILFAGIVNGKNIWKNSYEKSIKIIKESSNYADSIVLNTSCSLLHVPFTIKGEGKLSDEIKKHFSFAVEKLQELEELAEISSLKEAAESEYYKNNEALFKEDRDCKDESVQKRVREISEEDFIRKPHFYEREKIQKDKFDFPLFPTTTIGSFPQTKDVKKNRKDYRSGTISKEEYISFNQRKISEWIKIQEDIGLDVLVHGEFERNDMVEYFGESLKGYVFTEKAWVQSYGTRCVKPPIVWGDISREKPITVEWSAYAQSLTKKPLKGMLTGPVTILNWSFPREDISLEESVNQIALAIRDEVLDLEKAGLSIIQVDEAALREKLPLRKSEWYKEYLDWAIKAFRLVHSGVQEETQIHTHMCYSEFTDIIEAIDNMDADVITFEASRSNLEILDALKEINFKTEVGPGVYDIHSPRIPTIKEIKAVIEKTVQRIPKEKVWINPDCGLKTRGVEETIPSLENLVQAALEVREEY